MFVYGGKSLKHFFTVKVRNALIGQSILEFKEQKKQKKRYFQGTFSSQQASGEERRGGDREEDKTTQTSISTSAISFPQCNPEELQRSSESHRADFAHSGGRKQLMQKKQKRLTQKSGGFWDTRGVTACVIFPLQSINCSVTQTINLVESSLQTGTGIRFLYSLRFTLPQSDTLTHMCTYILLLL